MSQGKITTDHEKIRSWAERRGGRPARVKSTSDERGGGLLRIDFPDQGHQDSLEAASWDAFFRTFDERELAFLYQDETADGHESRFSRFIERDEEERASQHSSHKGTRADSAAHRSPSGAEEKPTPPQQGLSRAFVPEKRGLQDRPLLIPVDEGDARSGSGRLGHATIDYGQEQLSAYQRRRHPRP